MDTLDAKPPSFLPIPVDGSGQPLLSPGLTSKWVLQDRTCFTGSRHFTILLPFTSPLLLPLSLLGARTRLLSSRLAASILPTPHISTLLPSPSSLKEDPEGFSVIHPSP